MREQLWLRRKRLHRVHQRRRRQGLRDCFLRLHGACACTLARATSTDAEPTNTRAGAGAGTASADSEPTLACTTIAYTFTAVVLLQLH